VTIQGPVLVCTFARPTGAGLTLTRIRHWQLHYQTAVYFSDFSSYCNRLPSRNQPASWTNDCKL